MYVAWLVQMRAIYRQLELLIAERSVTDITPWRHAHDAERDLKYFGGEGGAVVVPATSRFGTLLDDWAAAEPIALLGPLYVLEGSTNGARYIARGVRKAYQLDGRDGTVFLDPYGDEQPAHWAEFKAMLDRTVRPAAVESVIRAAGATFDAIREIGAELQPA